MYRSEYIFKISKVILHQIGSHRSFISSLKSIIRKCAMFVWTQASVFAYKVYFILFWTTRIPMKSLAYKPRYGNIPKAFKVPF